MGNKLFAVIPIDEYNQILEDLDEFDDIKYLTNLNLITMTALILKII